MGMQLLLIVMVINLIGYLAGWHLARLYGFEKKLQIALSIEIGMQNAGLDVALALKHFTAETALTGAIFYGLVYLNGGGDDNLFEKEWLTQWDGLHNSPLNLRHPQSIYSLICLKGSEDWDWSMYSRM